MLNKITAINSNKINRLAGLWSCELSQYPDIKFSFDVAINPIVILYGYYNSYPENRLMQRTLEIVEVKYTDTQIIINPHCS